MYNERKRLMLSDYCDIKEIPFCKQKLKAQMFSIICKISKEEENENFMYWYSVLPLKGAKHSVQLSISAVVKVNHSDTQDSFRKIIPNMQKSLFSFLSSILFFGRNKIQNITEENMISKCPKCGTVVPIRTVNDNSLLKEELSQKEDELKAKDIIIKQLEGDIKQLRDDLEDIAKQLEKQKGMQEQIEELNHLAEEIETVEEVEINE